MDLSIEFVTVFVEHWEMILLFFVAAVIYSSVGFGGGSSYLAILSLSGLAFLQFRAISLLCNIVVVSGGSLIYFKHGLFNWKKIVPLALFSVPFAFIGGYMKIEQELFYIVLSITLLVVAISMGLSRYIKPSSSVSGTNLYKEGTIGSIIGFVSGMVGIGGGVFLAPLLHLSNWDTPKRISATASFFILVNSIAGLIGQYGSLYDEEGFIFDFNIAIALMITVFIGGQLGSRLGVKLLSPNMIKRITAALIFIVAIRMLSKYVF